MKTKHICAILILFQLVSFGTLKNSKTIALANEETSVSEVKTYTSKNKLPYISNPAWEKFENIGKYGSYSKTINYDDGTYKGTLTAVEFKATPKALKQDITENYEPVETSKIHTGSTGENFPAFPDQLSVSVTSSKDGKSYTGLISKSGDVKVVSSMEPGDYVSWGHIGNYDDAQNTYYGFMSQSSLTYMGSNKYADAKPNQGYRPEKKFYGALNVINHQDIYFQNEYSEKFPDPLSGIEQTGMTWADPHAMKGTDYPHLTYYGLFRSEFTTTYKARYVDLPLYTGPSTDYSKKIKLSGGILTLPTTEIVEASKRDASGNWFFIRVPSAESAGWIHKDNLIVVKNDTKRGENAYRKGATLYYLLQRYYETHTQNYAGNVKVADTVYNYADEWDIEVKYAGSVKNYSESNVFVKDVTLTKTSTEIPVGDTTNTNTFDVKYKIGHSHTGTFSDTSLNPQVKIYLNGKEIVSTNKKINRGSTGTEFTTEIKDVALAMGDNEVKVVINEDNKISENSRSGKDVKADNSSSAIHKGVYPSLVNLSVNSFEVIPGSGEIAPQDNTTREDLKMTFKIKSEVSVTGSKDFVPTVTIKRGAIVVYDKKITVPQGKEVLVTANLNDLLVSRGNNNFTVSVNMDKAITEVVPGKTNPYDDNSQSYNFIVSEAELNNLRVNAVKVVPNYPISKTPRVPEVRDVTLIAEIEHQLSAKPGTALMGPRLTVTYKGVKVYDEFISIRQSTKKEVQISLKNLLLSSTEDFVVTINGDRAIVEGKSGGINPYADNSFTKPYGLNDFTQCLLINPPNRRTFQSWTETWKKTTYSGNRQFVSGGSICRISNINTFERSIVFTEQYFISNVKFRSKFTKDAYNATLNGAYNAMPSKGTGWVDLSSANIGAIAIKGGYGFELYAETNYTTSRYRYYATRAHEFKATTSPSVLYNGPLGEGYCNFVESNVYHTKVETPDILIVTMYDSSNNPILCKFMVSTSKQDNPDGQSKSFELPEVNSPEGRVRKIFTTFGAKPGKYTVKISTTNPGSAARFVGYEEEYLIPNKGIPLHDVITFQLEILAQDDLKSHIVQ